MMARRVSLLVMMLAGCEGSLVGPLRTWIPETPETPETPEKTPAPLVHACDPSAVSRDVPLRRMSRAQVVSTFEAAVANLAPDLAPEILSEVARSFEPLPADYDAPPAGFGAHGFRRNDQVVTQAHVDASFALAEALARAMTSTPERRKAVFGACAVAPSAADIATCLSQWLAARGPRLLGAPSVSNDTVELVLAASSSARGTADTARLFADALTVFFSQPQFFFHLERGAPTPGDEETELDAYEVGARLAYLLTDAPPDDALWADIVSGEVLQDAVLTSHAQRLMKTSRAQSVRDAFFDDWFQVSRATADFTSASARPDYLALASGATLDATLSKAVVEDVLSMTRRVFESDAPVSTLLTDRAVASTHPTVRQLYGVDESGALPAGSMRAGLLTRLAFLTSSTVDTHPIRKGVRVRQAWLCDVLGAPPAGADSVRPTPTRPMTTREEVESITQIPSTTCVGCHGALINPLGFATESFDALGRERTTERRFSSTGTLEAELAVSTHGTVGLGDALYAFTQPAELTEAMVESGRFEACFASQYFRFASQNPQESRSADGCKVAPLEAAARQGASLSELTLRWVTAPHFRTRIVEP